MQLFKIDILLMMLRLSFGGKPCPYKWCITLESICDLANATLHDNNWGHDDFFAPNQHLVPEQMPLSDNTPFTKGAELIVDIPIDPRRMHNLYNDKIIKLMADIPRADYALRGQAAALLAIDVCAWPYHPEAPIPCKSMDARDKAGLTKAKMILGWEFNFWLLLISLPENQFIAWKTVISQLLIKGLTASKVLKLTISQLGHLALVVLGIHHFLSHLLELQQLATHRCLLCISETCCNDLLLMLCFLNNAKEGIDMNLVAFCQLNHIY
jgi:hypothetical protein